jgi:Concanavalin A-like lectin/glucanases superfamily/Bacterial Ig-like domain
MKTTVKTKIPGGQRFRNWTMAAFVLPLVFLAGMAQAQVTNIIYEDNFARTGLLSGTTPDTVDTGGATWWACTNNLTATPSGLNTDGSEIAATNYPNGTQGSYLNAFLPFTPVVGHVYTYTISEYGILGANQWLALGYALNELTNNYYAATTCGVAWELVRASGANLQSFLGPGTGSEVTYNLAGAVTNTMKIVLDTTTGNAANGWTVSWYANGVRFRQTAFAAGNPAIHYVGCGVDDATGYFQKFSLTDYAAASSPPTITEQPQNATLAVGQQATFWVNAAGIPAPTYQWRTNSVNGITNNITGATNAIYTTPALTLSPYNGLNYSVTVANFVGSTNSAPATLTVANTPATVFSAMKTAGLTNVVVAFSKGVDPTTGLNAANYSLNNGAGVSSVVYGSALSNSVIITTSTLSTNSAYYLTVQNVKDLFGNTTTNTTVPVLPAGLAIYLRADSGTVLDDNGNVDEWFDQTTNGDNAVQNLVGGPSARPAPATINSEPALNFNSSSSNFLTAASAPSLAITTSMTIYAVVNFANLSANNEILSKTVGLQAAPYDYYANTAGQELLYRGNGQSSGEVTSTAGASAGVPQVLAVVAGTNTTTVTHYLNGIANGSGTLTANIADGGNPLWIGGRNDLVQFMNGEMGEIMIFNGALSGADLTNVDNYLGAKYFQFAITQQPQPVTTSNGFTATFSVAASQGSVHFSYQWQENGTNIPGATGLSYTTPAMAPSDNGDTFDVAITLPSGLTTNSSAATLTVNNVPPTITSVGIPIWNTTNIIVLFSEAVDPTTATTVANYSLNNGASILSAAIGDAPNKVVLTTSALTQGTVYTLTVQDVQDLYGNAIVTASPTVGIYPASVALWVRGDTGVTTNADGTVAQWNDMSGNGNNLLGGTYWGFTDPLLTNSVSGDTVVHFVGTNGTYGSALYANDAASLEITGNMSVVAVVNFTLPSFAAGQGEIVSKTGSINANIPAPYDYNVASTGATTLRGNGNTVAGSYGSYKAPAGPSAGKPHIVAFTQSGNTVTHYIDGLPVGSAMLGANGGGTYNMTNCADQGQAMFVGGRGDFFKNNAEHLSGDISELIVAGSVLSSNDLASLDTYFMAEHNFIIPNPNPTNLVVSVAGQQLTLSWPMDHTGWLLQSNSVGLTATGAWANVAGSTGTNQITIIPSMTQTNVFYRMLYQP